MKRCKLGSNGRVWSRQREDWQNSDKLSMSKIWKDGLKPLRIRLIIWRIGLCFASIYQDWERTSKSRYWVISQKTFDDALKQTLIQERRIYVEKGPIRPALANKGASLLPNQNVASSYQNTSAAIAINNNLNRASARSLLKHLSHAEIPNRRERGL